MSALIAAATLVQISSGSLTNLQLQKLLYLSQMFYMGEHKRPIFAEDFEAWKLGPVLPAVYRKAKMYGGRPVETLFIPERVTDPTIRSCLENTYKDLGSLSASQLVNITHWGKGAWAKNYDGHDSGSTIPKSDIAREYDERVRLLKERRREQSRVS